MAAFGEDMIKNKPKCYSVLLIGLALLLAISLAACGQPQPAGESTSYTHYTNTKGAYSLEYPSGWQLEEINPEEIEIRPKHNWNRVQIGAFEDIPPVSAELLGPLSEANIRSFCGAKGFENVTIITNEAATGKWDWMTTYSFSYEEMPFFGTFLMKQTHNRLYTFAIVQVGDFPEGLKVLDSFTIIYSEAEREAALVESYLADIEAIINEVGDVALRVSNLYETAHQLESSEVVRNCVVYGKEYDDLLTRFVALKCPEECSKLREYVIDGITYSKQEVTEFGAAFATGDMEHLHKAESYYNEALKALALAAGEWDRLKKH